MGNRTGMPRQKSFSAGADALESKDLSNEIQLLRELLYQAAEAVDIEASANEKLRLLDVVARASGQLARLLRAQAALGGKDELAEEIGRIADEIRMQIAGQEDV